MSEPREPYNPLRQAYEAVILNAPINFWVLRPKPNYSGLGAKRRLLLKAGLLND